MDTERCGFDLISALYSIPLLLYLSWDSQTFIILIAESWYLVRQRTLPTSSEFLAILGLLLFQINFIIILSYPHQVHKRLWRTIWNWIKYMDKLRIYIITVFSSRKIIYISLYLYPFEYLLIQVLVSPAWLAVSSGLFRCSLGHSQGVSCFRGLFWHSKSSSKLIGCW